MGNVMQKPSATGGGNMAPLAAITALNVILTDIQKRQHVDVGHITDLLLRYASDLDRREGDFREECFQKLVKEIKLQAITKPQPSNASAGNDDINWQPPVPLLCTALIKIFLANILGDARRSIGIYHILLDLLQSTELPQEVKVDISKVLVSLRSDVKYRIFVEVSPEFQDWWTSSLESPPTNSSRILTSQAGARMTPNIFTPTPYEESLNARWWLRFVATSMVRDQKCHWDVFWLNINHVAAQLTNQSLFKGTEDQLKELRGALCSQLRKGNFQRPPEGSDLKAGDVAVRLYGILTVLIGYHDAFTKSEQEEMIVAFIYGMTAWEQTTLPCIHALTICCYELSKALEKNAYTIVTKMANIVTKSDAAIHVLEFLTGLSRITDLARSLKEDEIKTIFGVGFSYIDYVRGKRFDDAQKARGSVSGSTQPKPKMDIPGYLYALAYHVIAFWFLTLKPEDQKLHLSFVDFRLLSPDQRGMKEDQALSALQAPRGG
ncbi:Tuberous sclerosis 2-like protein [Zalaria obscura]|uniref:Tuberous sclerosis 2-like protein n=1 Tax=Zalaria obscura TaxID=2024903 RepID=A0ACC3SB86_9PEZI